MGIMKKIQLTVIQLDNYGPWTVTPKPKPEPDLQILQAEVYRELQRQFSDLGGLVFQTRHDNFIAVSNGISLDKHREMLSTLAKKFPITASMGLGYGVTPYEAQVQATLALQSSGSSRSEKRKSVLIGMPLKQPDEDWVEIVHADINHSTLFTDTKPIYDTHFLIQRTHLSLIDHMLRHNALVFYMGGDNFMALANGISEGVLKKIFVEIKREVGVELKAGIGASRGGREAAHLASEALQEIRLGKVKNNVAIKTA